MKSLSHWLALLALAALAMYVLACRSSFSPDGSKILVTAVGGPYQQGHLLVYDRKAATWTPLLTVARMRGGDSVPIPVALWSGDGKEVVATWASDKDKLTVSVLPVGGAGPTRLYELEVDESESDGALMTTAVPPVLHDRNLLFGGESITVLNLESGQVDRQVLPGNEVTNAPKQAIYLVGQGKEVHYLMGGGATVEAGRLDLADLKHLHLSPQLQLEAAKGDGSPFLAVTANGTRIAMTTGNADAQNLQIYHRSQLERTFPFGADTNHGIILGNLVWAPDGRTLYAAGFKALKAGPIAKALHAGYQALRAVGFNPNEPRPLDLEMSLCEIPLDGRPIRETPLFRLACARDETFRLLYQVALSPDGRTIAATDGFSDMNDRSRKANLALYLVDVAGKARPVTRIPIPRAVAVSAGLVSE